VRPFATVLLVLAVAAGAAACGSDAPVVSSTADELFAAGRVAVGIRDLVIDAEPARTGQERSLGLGGRESMPEDEGMLFFQGEERIPGFSMRGMLFPLDFIWISGELRVAAVTEEVPSPSMAGGEVVSVRPGVPVLYVLEVNAGTVADAGIEIGDIVTLTAVGPER
jgi:hypothetical protein